MACSLLQNGLEQMTFGIRKCLHTDSLRQVHSTLQRSSSCPLDYPSNVHIRDSSSHARVYCAAESFDSHLERSPTFVGDRWLTWVAFLFFLVPAGYHRNTAEKGFPKLSLLKYE